MFLVHGSDDFIIKKQVDLLVKKIKETDLDAITSEYSLLQDSWQKICLDIDTYDMFGNKKIIIINDALFLTESKQKMVSDFKINDVIEYVSSIRRDVFIIFILKGEEKMSKRLKIVKLFEEKVKIIATTVPNDKILFEQIKRRFKEKHITYDDGVIDLFLDIVPKHMSIIQSELSKLIDVKKHITIAIINEVLTKSNEYDVFLISNALIDGNLKLFINMWHAFEQQNGEMYSFLSLLAINLVDLRNVLFYREIGWNLDQISDAFKMNPYRTKILSNRFKVSWRQLNENIVKLNRLIYNINVGFVNKTTLTEITLLKIFS